MALTVIGDVFGGPGVKRGSFAAGGQPAEEGRSGPGCGARRGGKTYYNIYIAIINLSRATPLGGYNVGVQKEDGEGS